jgi:hypothetical protein
VSLVLGKPNQRLKIVHALKGKAHTHNDHLDHGQVACRATHSGVGYNALAARITLTLVSSCVHPSRQANPKLPLFILGIRHVHSATVGVLGPTAHPRLSLKVFLGVGWCRRL